MSLNNIKIGILTFHASHNYGSMLQAYSLLHALQHKGFDVNVINLRTEKQRNLYPFPLLYKRPYRYNIHLLLNSPLLCIQDSLRWIKFEMFLKKYIVRYSPQLCKTEEIEAKNYDVLICGGDQIWNLYCDDFDNAYFLPFEGVKKISYSPSLGNEADRMKTSEDFKNIFRKYLSSFSAISVREPDGKEFILNVTNVKNVEVVPDPIFFLGKDDFLRISKKPLGYNTNKKYILYYTPKLQNDTESYNVALKFAEQIGLELLTTEVFDGIQCSNYRNDCGPREFLYLLEHAQIIIGKSFHLAALSLIFHKEFYIINGEKDRRLSFLLNSFQLTDRCVDGNNFFSVSNNEIDFSKIDKTITRMKVQALNYLLDCIKI